MPGMFRGASGRAARLASVALALSAPRIGLAQPDREVQWWKGTFETQGVTIDFVVVFRPTADAGGYTATIDIPAQGAKDLALTDVSLAAAEIRFALTPPNAPPSARAVFELKRGADGTTATGNLKQYGMTFPTRMEHITEDEAKAVGPLRPQTPEPPFPYTQREVTYENPVDHTKLAGTLTVPVGAGPHPVVILITGSGAEDRDETIFGHKPFLVLADHLTRHGVAVLRVDDRGVGGSSGSTYDSTSKDFANDVIAGIKFLQKQPEIDGRRIGLVGHSEGGLIAPLVASKSKDVACIVLLAGPGLPGARILNMQLEALLRAGGMPANKIEPQSRAQRALIECIVSDADAQAVRQAARNLLESEAAAAGKSAELADKLESAADGVAKGVGTPWMRSFLKLDPREVLPKVKCPVLALAGALDLQVPPKENLAEIEQALKAGGNTNVTAKELPGLNHLFQEAQTGLPDEYVTIAQTIAPAALDEITAWLRARFKLEP